MQLIITIPQKVSLNKVYAGMHWKLRHELAFLYHQEMLDKPKLKIKKREYPVTITYTFYFTKNALDSLNCALMAKMLEDGMVQAGILFEDAPDYVSESRLKTLKSKLFKHDTVVIDILPAIEF